MATYLDLQLRSHHIILIDFLNGFYYCITHFIRSYFFLSMAQCLQNHAQLFSLVETLFCPSSTPSPSSFFFQLLSLSIVTLAALCPSVSFALCIFYRVMPDSKAKYNSTTWPLHEIMKKRKKGHGTVAVIFFFLYIKTQINEENQGHMITKQK